MKRLIAPLAAAATLSSCATMPEPCTTEWFDWKTERFIGEFVADHRKQISDLREIAPTMFGPEGGLEEIAPTSMLVLTAIGALDLVLDFTKDAMPQIKQAVSECSTGPRATQLFTSMLRKEGVDERAIKAIENLGNLMDSDR